MGRKRWSARERGGRPRERLACVVVVDLGGKEFLDALRGHRRRCEKGRVLQLGRKGEDDFCGHSPQPSGYWS